MICSKPNRLRPRKFITLRTDSFEGASHRHDAVGDLAAVTGEAVHDPAATTVIDVLQRPIRCLARTRPLAGTRCETVTFIRNLPPLAWRGLLGLRAERFVPAAPEFIEDFPIKVRRQARLTEEQPLLPQGAIVVNTARGGVVDTAAVVAALADGHLACAGIDVLEQEPPPEDSPVLRAWRDPNHPAHDRLLINPHTAYYCEQGSEEFRTKGSLEVLRALQGQSLRNRVN